ncbi:MAG: DUF975 family protein [Lachnospiraceae bacterium]|nr:DUF975 family protein [Candidatus Colinaster scatohippi]
MWTREEVKARGKAALNRNYWYAVLTAVVLGICAGGSGGSSAGSSYNNAKNNGADDLANIFTPQIIAIILGVACVAILISIALKIFVFNPIAVGCQRFFILNDSENASLNEIGYGFKNDYMNIVKIMFLKDLYIFLWTLLLIVPGIIKSYEYMLVPYLLAEDSSLSADEIFALSKDMMMGNKMDAFVLQLSFIGWVILTVFTCGILGLFYVNPYIYGTMAAMYLSIKEGLNPTDAYYDPYANTAM